MPSPRIDLRRRVLGRAEDVRLGLIAAAVAIAMIVLGVTLLALFHHGLAFLLIVIGMLVAFAEVRFFWSLRSPPRHPSPGAIASLRVSAAQAMGLGATSIDGCLLLWGICCEPACREAIARCGAHVDEVRAKLREAFQDGYPRQPTAESYRSVALAPVDEDAIHMGADAARVLERGRRRAQPRQMVLPLEWLVALADDDEGQRATGLLRACGVTGAKLRAVLGDIPFRASGDVTPPHAGTYGVVLLHDGTAPVSEVVPVLVDACELAEDEALFHARFAELAGHAKLGVADEATARARVRRLIDLSEKRGHAARAYVENALSEVPLSMKDESKD